jgi:hypothetical protein
MIKLKKLLIWLGLVSTMSLSIPTTFIANILVFILITPTTWCLNKLNAAHEKIKQKENV